MIKVFVQKTMAQAVVDTPLTSGSKGVVVEFVFSEDWNGFAKTAVFATSSFYKETAPLTGETIEVPEDVMVWEDETLYIGVYGTAQNGETVLPTVYADCGRIHRGANDTPGGRPLIPAQSDILQNQINDLGGRVGWLESGGGISLDTTLTQSGMAADAKVVGDALAKKQDAGNYLTDHNTFVGDVNTSSEAFYEAFSARKPCFLLRSDAGSGMVMWVAHDCTSRAARFYNVTPDGTVRYATLEGLVFSYESAAGGSGNVFVGDANTTVAEFYEADNAGKVCFMKRPQGGSGIVTWVAYNCSTSGAWFYHVNSTGKVEYGRLASDGSWSYTSASIDLDTTLTQSGKAADAKAVGDALAVYVLSLSTDEADAQANSDAVTAAIAEHGHVVLKAGKYPAKPGIVIESGKLDMNGAHFYTVDYKSSTPLVYLKGESPEICNGELEGSYDLANGDEGYEFFESESLIRPEGVNGAYIHHMDMHHNWGYCISPGENVQSVHAGTATMTGENENRFTTEAFEIPEGYKYVTAAGGIGYNYIISISNVAYRFYDENGTGITTKHGVPRKRIPIPDGAKTVTFDTKPGGNTFVPYYAYFTNYEETLTVADCKFHHFHSLGMANFPGPTTVTRCDFSDAATPRSGASGGNYRATTGGIDIEDVQTPEFIMSDCTGRNCGKLLMFGGYKGVVSNCSGDSVLVYRGWNCDLSNCNVTHLSVHDSGCRVSTNGVHADELWVEGDARYNVRGNISTNGIPKKADGSVSAELFSCFDSFIVKIEKSADTQGNIAGRLNGRIECTGTSGYRGVGISSEKGSRLEFDVKVADNNRNYYGACGVSGETYGLIANATFFPQGHTIHDSTFNIAAATTPYSTTDGMLDGGFENCVFNLTGAAYFRRFTGTLTKPISLTFENCIINNADNYLFNYVPQAGGAVTFKNCTIADESKLFNGDASSMTINIVTGGEGGVAIDASLSVEGAAADAKAVGDALDALESKIPESGGGGSMKWRLLCDTTVTAETDPDGVAAVETTTFADGKTLVGAGITEIVFGGWVTQKADTTYAHGTIEINNAGIIVGQNIGIATGAKRFFMGRVQLLGGGMASVTFGSGTAAQSIDANGGGVVINPHGGGANVPAIAAVFGDEVAKVKVKHAATGGLFGEARLVVFGR